ncbi:molybdopterin-containing oxidoreductase family protein [Parahaliea mediterranea]|uniref:molybdopterin-containing oxidoreductase family protein n=1 Tax=Parahaliea mediterranea TaxID=651086 RepID=UPI000E2FC87F|nr:molybdopterin dinucleotide binding domain-containing protein [Parahaliea mediterranea]
MPTEPHRETCHTPHKTVRHTFCRACHACCSVLVDIEDGVATAVRGNRDSPLYQGFCCIKGQHYADQCNHPTRLLHSLKRQVDGSYRPLPVQQAIDEIGDKLLAIRERHGPRAIAAYIGTFGSTSSSANTLLSSALMDAIGSPMNFSSNTIDQPGKFVAAALFGEWMAPSNNFAEADVVMLIGLNPLVSMSGGMPHTNPGRHLTAALKRGMQLLVIDPRRSETARRATIHLQSAPGCDVLILAAMLRTIIADDLIDRDFVAAHTRGLAALQAAVAPFTPERVAREAGVDAATLIDMAHTFARAGKGVATAGTGPNMSGNTTLLEYLVRCLNTVCGRWARAGERVIEPGTLSEFIQPRAQAMDPRPEWAYGFGEPLVRGLANTAAGLPTAALPDEILRQDEGRVRALISHGGNPVSVWPDQIKTLAAYEALELSVQIDLRMSASASCSDYVIAARHPLEMPGISLVHEFMSSYAPGFGTVAPWAQYTDAVVEPPKDSDVIEDWRFFYRLAQRMGLPLTVKPILWAGESATAPWPLDMQHEPDTEALFEQITRNARVPLAEVKRHPGGAIFDEPAVHVAAAEPGWQGRLDLGNAQMMALLAQQLERATTALEAHPYRLISRRQINVLNSTGHELPGQTHGKAYNPAYLHPLDLAALGVDAGARIRIRSARADITAIAEADNNLRRGTVSMTHGWGDRLDPSLDISEVGSSTARLIANDVDYEPFTGLPRMSNIPVSVQAL